MAIMKDDVTPKHLKSHLSTVEMVDSDQQKYLLINLLSRRARDINEGSRALVELPVPYTPIDLSIAEARAGKLKVVRLDELEAEKAAAVAEAAAKAEA